MALHEYFTKQVGTVVDLNLDYFPDMIICTFVNTQDIQRALEVRDFRFATAT